MKPLISIVLLAIVIVIACKPTNSNIPPLQGTMDVADAKRLVKNYGDKNDSVRTGFKSATPDSTSDTRCVWFDLRTIKGLIATMEDEAKADTSIKADGIRFYFATYDSLSIKKYDIRPRYNKYNTLIMVSTKKEIDGADTVHVDYWSLAGKRKILTAMPENQGELCPPPTNCTKEGALLLEN
jgi:hypothetical protein